ncbi:hypothetical protein V1525DRAFT_426726 [Lipomyces kononenkoae]|uniref:Uncharacterized protein n=1 Tax=Lipomyces kononenkoae TaxID=34357 RepID=A0ACC3T1F5_LIPKO
MPRNRSLGRNVHIYDISQPDNELGELRLAPSFTKKTLFFALEILIISDSPRIFITNEFCMTRILSHTVGRDEKFRKRVRARDGKCVITGVANPQWRVDEDNWSIYHATHIFPLSGKNENENDSPTNSCQNGLLMRADVHAEFDNFSISINVDDDYKVVNFTDDILNVGGRQLDPVCRDPQSELSARDELLRWHFCQAVDMVGEITSGPEAAKRVEAELFSRLKGCPSPKDSSDQDHNEL